MSRLPNALKGLRLPVIAAPMFIVNHPATVIAQCKAGIAGTMPSLNARPVAQLDDWLAEITETLAAHDRAHPDLPAAPFGINLIVNRGNDRVEQDLAMITKHRVPLVITSLGARPEVNAAVHAYGGIVLHDVINNGFARKAVEKGADGLIAVAAGAGGHAGVKSPFALVQEIRQWFDGPLALGGAIASGSAVLAAQVMGADFAYIGSAFIATQEARASEAYKQCVVDCDSDDIVYTNLFTGVHGNYLKPSIRSAGLDPDKLPEARGDSSLPTSDRLDQKWSARSVHAAEGGSPKPAPMALGDGAKAWKDVWGCGQGIGAIREITSTAGLIARLAEEYQFARERVLKGVTP